MPNPGSYSSDDALPLSSLLARGRDRSWHAESRCRTATGDMKRAWMVEPSKYVVLSDGARVRGEELITMALTICRTCPVQWECTKWAVEVGEAAGTWGVHPSDLNRLKADPTRSVELIGHAKRRQIPVQVAIHTLVGITTTRSRASGLV